MESLISSMPVMRAMKPSRMVPTPCFFSLLVNMKRIMPTVPSRGARVVGLKICTSRLSPSSWVRESSQAVTVVPMLEPIMTPMACCRVMMPELTKPTTMTVVAEED